MRTDALASPFRRPLRAKSARVAPLMLLIFLSAAPASFAQQNPAEPEKTRIDLPTPGPSPTSLVAPLTNAVNGAAGPVLPDLTKRETFSSAMQIIILLTVLSLAPAILIMMTSFTRIIIVMSLLRQALGTASLPPNQVLIGLSLFMTFLIMSPTWQRVNSEALSPYMDGKMSQQDALSRAQIPLREFMIRQIERSGN